MPIKIKDKGFDVSGNITLREILNEIKHEAFMVDMDSPVCKKVEAICKHYLEMIE